VDNAELLPKLRAQLVRCAGFENDELTTDRAHALDYYHMRPNGTEVEGRATAVSGDLSAMIESNLAAMMEAFSSSRVVEFDPLDAADEEQAQLESDAVCYFVMGQQNGAWHLAQAIKDTLGLRNGWVKAWCEEERAAKIEEYTNVEPEALQELTTKPNAECKILVYDEASKYLKLRCIYTAQRFRAEAIAVENVFYPKAYDGADYRALQEIPFIAERHVEMRGELVRRGFSREKVNRVTAYKSDASTTAAARNPRRDTELTPGVDEASELVEWFECYVMLDGGDGIAERQKVCVDGGFREVLARDPATHVPYATGQVFIAAHRLTGISLWDKLRQSQDVNTALTRALLDNVQATSKSRLAYLDGKANVDDVGDGRVNGAIRVKPSVARVSDAVMPFVVPDTSQGIKDAIAHQRQIRTELGGSTLDMQAGELQVSKQVGSMGLDRAFSVAEQLAAHMTKNIADTLIRSTFLLAHAMLREHYTQPVPVKRGGRWESATPSEWQPRERLTVKIGMSPGERTRRQASLDKLLQTHITLAQLGMQDVLVNIDGFYSLLMDWGRVADIQNPERYFVDPRSKGSVEAQDKKQKEQQAQQAQQAQLVAQAVELEKLKTALDKYQTDTTNAIDVWKTKVETRFKYVELAQEAEVEEAKLVGNVAKDLVASKLNGSNSGREEPTGKSATPQDA
jgi:hypothetical protein